MIGSASPKRSKATTAKMAMTMAMMAKALETDEEEGAGDKR